MHRRKFIGASALAGSIALAAPPPEPKKESIPPPDVVPTPDATRILAKYVVSAKLADLPAPVRKEAARTLLNWVGCTIGGSRNEAVGIAISALRPFFGDEQASLLGRRE